MGAAAAWRPRFCGRWLPLGGTASASRFSWLRSAYRFAVVVSSEPLRWVAHRTVGQPSSKLFETVRTPAMSRGLVGFWR